MEGLGLWKLKENSTHMLELSSFEPFLHNNTFPSTDVLKKYD